MAFLVICLFALAAALYFDGQLRRADAIQRVD